MGQSKAIAEHFQKCFPESSIEVLPDLAGIQRVVKARI
jgi:hypothetical protein